MHVFNLDGESVELPESYTRKQRDAALDALGIPRHIGLFRTTIDNFHLTIEFYEFAGAKKRRVHAGETIALKVKIPMGDSA